MVQDCLQFSSPKKARCWWCFQEKSRWEIRGIRPTTPKASWRRRAGNNPSPTLPRHHLGCVEPKGQVPAPKQTSGAGSSPSSGLNYTLSPCRGLKITPEVKVRQGKAPPRLVNPNTEDNHRPPLSSTKPLRYRLGGVWGGKIYGKNKFLLPSSRSSPSAHPRDRPRFDGPRLWW